MANRPGSRHDPSAAKLSAKACRAASPPGPAHPHWIVPDRHTGGPLVCLEFYGVFRGHQGSEEYYLLDLPARPIGGG